MSFEGLSPEQREFIAYLAELLESGMYESDLHFFGTLAGWTVLLSGKPGQEGLEIESLSETQLLFIESKGYLYLVPHGDAQFTGMLPPEAFQEYRMMKKRILRKNAEKIYTELEEIRQQFVDDVVGYYEKSDRERGDASFDRWQERFSSLLEENLPSELSKYQVAMSKGPRKSRLLGVSEISYFMDNKGSRVLAFIDTLCDEIKRGRLDGIVISVSNKQSKDVRMKEQVSPIPATDEITPDPRRVFVVHGRNQRITDSMFDFLRSINLHPIEWTEAVKFTGKGTPYVGEILDSAFQEARAVIVLFTPDDEARLKLQFISETEPGYESTLTGQARPNVIFEAGLAFGRDPDRTILVEVGPLRPFSDISGLHVVRLTNDVERRQALAMRLSVAGCDTSLDGTDWHSVGDFSLEQEPLASTDSQPEKDSNVENNKTVVEIRREIKSSSNISSDHKNYQKIHSDFLQYDQCTILLWVLVPEIEQGLRNSPHNRYIISHQTHEENDGQFNLFALRHSVDKWQICYSNNQAETSGLNIDDGLEIGWHQFMIAWDCSKPDLVFTIDGGKRGKDTSRLFLQYWPSNLVETATIGAWISPYEDSYCNTRLSHLWVIDAFVETEDELIREHLSLKPY